MTYNSKMSQNKATILVILLALLCAVKTITTVSSFKELAAVHCKNFPVELLHRLSTGRLSEQYGKDFRDIDCYIRQFVNKGTFFFTQTAKIHSKRRILNRTKRKDNQIEKKRWFQKLILLLLSMLQDWPAFLRESSQSRLFMRCGASTDLSFNMTICWSGWGRKWEPHLDMRLKSQVLGWTGSSQHQDLGFRNYFQISSMTISTNSCLEISFIRLLLFSNAIPYLLRQVLSQFRESLF